MSLSILGVFGAGLLTFISPCVLPMAPIMIANLLSVKDVGRWERFRATLWFTLGFSLIFVLMGLSLPALTSLLGGAKPYLIGVGGALLALFGLRMMGALGESKLASWLTRSFHLPMFASRLPKGLQGLVFGALFGLSWTPCVGPVLGGVLTYVASQEASPAQGAVLLGAFALGISLPLIALAVGYEYVSPALGRMKRFLPRIEYAAGLGLFVFGVFVLSQVRLQDFSLRSAPTESIAAVDSRHNPVRLDEGKPNSTRMVFFYSENCPICHQMERYLPEFEKSCTSSHFELVRINVDLPENSRVASHFGIRAVPTTALLTDRGAEVVRLVGYQTQSRLRDAARTVTKVECAKGDTSAPLNLDEKLRLPGEKTSCDVGAAC